jgi:hypothetical protein
VKVYVASSWKTVARQQLVVWALREAGHDAYDFRNPESAFAWKEAATSEQLHKERRRLRARAPVRPECSPRTRLGGRPRSTYGRAPRRSRLRAGTDVPRVFGHLGSVRILPS